MYGDGIQAQPGQQSKTALNQISPGLLIGLGNHWNLDFTPTLSFYSSSAFKDTTDYSVLLSGATTYKDWAFGLSQGFVSSSQPLVETASQTDTETFSTTLSANWSMNDKLSLELGVDQTFLSFGESAPGQQLTDSRTWSTLDWLNYQLSPRFSVALGAGFFYTDMAAGSDFISEQIQGRIDWRPGNKLSLTASVGGQGTQFMNSSQPAYVNPVFGVILRYQIFEPTTLFLTANEALAPSYFQNQITDTTAFSASIRQRLFNKLFLGVTGSYSTTSYQAAQVGTQPNSQNDYTSITFRLACPFLERGLASVFYSWSDNSSNQPGFAYTSNQIGFDLGYHF
jgi:hypothetical protein